MGGRPSAWPVIGSAHIPRRLNRCCSLASEPISTPAPPSRAARPAPRNKKGIDRHHKCVGDGFGRNRHLHRDLVPTSGHGRIGRAHQHGDGRCAVGTLRACGSSHRPDGRNHSRRGLVIGQRDHHVVADRHLGLLVGIEGDADLARGRSRRHDRLPCLDRSAQRGGDRSDSSRRWQENNLTQGQSAVLRHPEGGLEFLDPVLGCCVKGIRRRCRCTR
jgi:hypothetical protein